MKDNQIIDDVAAYYSAKLAQHGPTARGVDWNGEASQQVRFEQLCKILGPEKFSILDYGCGYGALLEYLRPRHKAFSYLGFDAAEAMTGAAAARHSDSPEATWTNSVNGPECLSDYVVSSGIFHVKLDIETSRWAEYVLSLLHRFDQLSRRGFAFNCLTSYSDAERMRDDLYYPQPEQIFGYCKENFSRDVALLHDYKLYEFTILVRKE